MNESNHKLIRIGIFYDGNFFYHVSQYYRYSHSRRQRISIPGLHEFIRHHIALVEGVDAHYCHIVDAHFFRGRLSAREADAQQKLFAERAFEDILMSEGVVTHYLPVRNRAEKGIDVWLALEAYELTVYKQFNILVLIGGDSDFVPLVRKVNSLGTRVMVLGWDFSYTDTMGQDRETVTSIRLLDEVTYPVMMHQIIDDKTRRDDSLIHNLFVQQREEPAIILPPVVTQPATNGNTLPMLEMPPSVPGVDNDGLRERFEGEVLSLNQGFGFIRSPRFPNNVFFHWSELSNKDFNVIKKGDRVFFSVHQGEKGPVADEIEVIE